MAPLHTSFPSLNPKVIHRPKLILASQSESRRDLLKCVGIEFAAVSSDVDESPIKESGKSMGKTIEEVAMELAVAKAKAVSKYHPEAVVIGCDQMMQCQGIWIDKAQSFKEAKEHLQLLRGKTHQLYTAICCVQAEEILWDHLAIGELTMWDFDDDYIDDYLHYMGPNVLNAVGCYPVENRGITLFSHIGQDIFTVRGLPLLPLLIYLRSQDLLTFN